MLPLLMSCERWKRLTALAPQTARVEREGVETILPIQLVQAGETVLVRPGETIPVDGEVISGQATINQATITGESMPVDVTVGSRVFAATLAELGSLRVRATHVGADTTFGRVITMVEKAEAHRAPVQRIADRFSAYFLPAVATIAALTFLISRNPLAAAAVLVVACSCSFALATPIAMLASIGAAASHGLLVKGGKYLEALSRADVLLIDKTGTITMGRPRIVDVVPLDGASEEEVLMYAASAERDSEHPLAEAVRQLAWERGLSLFTPQQFEAIPGRGVRACVEHMTITVGNASLMQGQAPAQVQHALSQQGKTLLYVERDGKLIGLLAASDTIRPEVPAALLRLRALGITHIELLTGDTRATAAAQAEALGITHQAHLLPEDKIRVVKAYQQEGRIVVMVGDGVNDAPALAQADVGIAMGVMGTDIAIEAAHVALMREDWNLVPDLFTIARRTMRVVKTNLIFTILYNLVGLLLAAVGILPPILAAAAQSLPDLGILANSARLLRQRLSTSRTVSPIAVSRSSHRPTKPLQPRPVDVARKIVVEEPVVRSQRFTRLRLPHVEAGKNHHEPVSPMLLYGLMSIDEETRKEWDVDLFVIRLLSFIWLPVAAMLLGGLIALLHTPSRQIGSAIQHFAAGMVFAAVAIELLPDVISKHAPIATIGGFALGLMLMLVIRQVTEHAQEEQPQKKEQGRFPTGPVLAVGVDIFIDGLLMGIGFVAGARQGILLTVALTLELLSLGRAVRYASSKYHFPETGCSAIFCFASCSATRPSSVSV